MVYGVESTPSEEEVDVETEKDPRPLVEMVRAVPVSILPRNDNDRDRTCDKEQIKGIGMGEETCTKK